MCMHTDLGPHTSLRWDSHFHRQLQDKETKSYNTACVDPPERGTNMVWTTTWCLLWTDIPSCRSSEEAPKRWLCTWVILTVSSRAPLRKAFSSASTVEVSNWLHWVQTACEQVDPCSRLMVNFERASLRSNNAPAEGSMNCEWPRVSAEIQPFQHDNYNPPECGNKI